jgi:hypothetical protein
MGEGKSFFTDYFGKYIEYSDCYAKHDEYIRESLDFTTREFPV